MILPTYPGKISLALGAPPNPHKEEKLLQKLLVKRRFGYLPEVPVGGRSWNISKLLNGAKRFLVWIVYSGVKVGN